VAYEDVQSKQLPTKPGLVGPDFIDGFLGLGIGWCGSSFRKGNRLSDSQLITHCVKVENAWEVRIIYRFDSM